ncbi:hypothetical protein EIZ62_06725 [Streptomyces ficellus]|uniref:Uncharacterized protein n=1 Tax=Streptomyces ficellus TaxID=1977088 RepID=A0A6I6F2T4_9ACTN|nr:hypothetical protein EIZ62_06725 [Streptomyces ficellus]
MNHLLRRLSGGDGGTSSTKTWPRRGPDRPGGSGSGRPGLTAERGGWPGGLGGRGAGRRWVGRWPWWPW